ncbi:TPA_asm: P8 [Erysimum trirhavirus 1]|nr:TPA_asm: P8 [Erysimum trirhavirus 1]
MATPILFRRLAGVALLVVIWAVVVELYSQDHPDYIRRMRNTTSSDKEAEESSPLIFPLLERSLSTGESMDLVCTPEHLIDPKEGCLEVPADMEVGFFRVIAVEEWRVALAKSLCYHDFIVRKWDNTVDLEEIVTLQKCKDMAHDISDSVFLLHAECTLFNDASISAHLKVGISHSGGKIIRSDPEFFLHTPRSNIEVSDLSDGEHIGVSSNNTCVLYDIRKETVRVRASIGVNGFEIDGVNFRFKNEFKTSGVRCWTTNAFFEACECKGKPEEDTPLLNSAALTLSIRQQQVVQKHRTLIEFCAKCRKDNLISLSLGLLCEKGVVYHYTIIKASADLEFKSGRFQNRGYVFDPEYGVLIRKGSPSSRSVKMMEYLPRVLYINRGEFIDNCTVDQNSKRITDKCTPISLDANTSFSDILDEYRTSTIFLPKVKQRLDQVMYRGHNILGDLAVGLSSIWGWITNKLWLMVTLGVSAILLCAFLYYMVKPREHRYHQVIIGARGTTLREDNV